MTLECYHETLIHNGRLSLPTRSLPPRAKARRKPIKVAKLQQESPSPTREGGSKLPWGKVRLVRGQALKGRKSCPTWSGCRVWRCVAPCCLMSGACQYATSARSWPTQGYRSQPRWCFPARPGPSTANKGSTSPSLLQKPLFSGSRPHLVPHSCRLVVLTHSHNHARQPANQRERRIRRDLRRRRCVGGE